MINERFESTGFLQEFNQYIASFNKHLVADYFLSAQMGMTAIMAMCLLISSRGLQSWLYHPNGFSREIIGFEGSRKIFLSFLSLFFVYNNMSWGVTLFLASLSYLMFSGFSLTYTWCEAKKNKQIMIGLLLFVFLVPQIILIILLIIGFLDCAFKLKVRMLAKIHNYH